MKLIAINGVYRPVAPQIIKPALCIAAGLLCFGIELLAETCRECHRSQHSKWQGSHHAMAMTAPTQATVRAPFSGERLGGWRFIQDDNRGFFAERDQGRKKLRVLYAFGWEPLQQYLVSAPGGRLQVLPVAWDTRERDAGGQRWYFLPDPSPEHDDRFHWQQPLANWNGMCADCHADGLQRDFDVAENRFNTRAQALNVGCRSCHDGLDPQHGEKTHEAPATGRWQRTQDQATAHWQGPKRDPRRDEICYACHSLRTPLTDGFRSDQRYLDNFRPELPSPPLYFPDGQIREEVYVYGSFLQSKMHLAGVGCGDCHDPHTAAIKLPGNDLCSQCHAPTTFDVATHHFHPPDSEGSQCVNCHMPARVYMGVDDRRDHSFRIPRPEFSARYESPDVCIDCHVDRDAKWAAAQIRAHHPRAKPVDRDVEDWTLWQAGNDLSVSRRQDLATSKSLGPLRRAAVLVKGAHDFSLPALEAFARDRDPLVRLGTVSALASAASLDIAPVLRGLLEDEFRAIRVAAAEALARRGELLSRRPESGVALTELREAYVQNAWRGEGLMNLGLLSALAGDEGVLDKLLFYRWSVERDPFFADAYLNYAETLRERGQREASASVLRRGLAKNSGAPALHYAVGLQAVREQNRALALEHLERAHRLALDDEQFAYGYMLGLFEAGMRDRAACVAADAVSRGAPSSRLVELSRQLALPEPAGCAD